MGPPECGAVSVRNIYKTLAETEGFAPLFSYRNGIIYILEVQVAMIVFLFGEEGWNE